MSSEQRSASTSSHGQQPKQFPVHPVPHLEQSRFERKLVSGFLQVDEKLRDRAQGAENGSVDDFTFKAKYKGRLLDEGRGNGRRSLVGTLQTTSPFLLLLRLFSKPWATFSYTAMEKVDTGQMEGAGTRRYEFYLSLHHCFSPTPLLCHSQKKATMKPSKHPN